RRDGCGDRVGGGADGQGAARQHQEVADHQVGVDVGREGEGAGVLDLQRVEGRGGVDVVGDGVARLDVHDVAGRRQPAQGPDGRVGPVAALDGVDGRGGPEVRDGQVGRDDGRGGVRQDRGGADRGGGGGGGAGPLAVGHLQADRVAAGR